MFYRAGFCVCIMTGPGECGSALRSSYSIPDHGQNPRILDYLFSVRNTLNVVRFVCKTLNCGTLSLKAPEGYHHTRGVIICMLGGRTPSSPSSSPTSSSIMPPGWCGASWPSAPAPP